MSDDELDVDYECACGRGQVSPLVIVAAKAVLWIQCPNCNLVEPPVSEGA